MGLSFDEIKERKRPSRREVKLSLDPQRALDVIEAQETVEEAKRGVELRPGNAARQQVLDDAEEELERAKEAVEPHLVTFVVQALGREKFEELRDDHPPTKAQRDRFRKENPEAASVGRTLSWNDDTFPPALLAACVVEPDLTESQAKELWNGEVFNQGETAMLLAACLEVNQNHRVVDLGKGSKPTAPSGSNSPSVLSTA